MIPRQSWVQFGFASFIYWQVNLKIVDHPDGEHEGPSLKVWLRI